MVNWFIKDAFLTKTQNFFLGLIHSLSRSLTSLGEHSEHYQMHLHRCGLNLIKVKNELPKISFS